MVKNEHRIENNSIDNIALGVPGSLSNKPPVTGEENKDSKNTNERTEINRQYALGSSVRHTQYQQGKLNKLNVSVLLTPPLRQMAVHGQKRKPSKLAP